MEAILYKATAIIIHTIFDMTLMIILSSTAICENTLINACVITQIHRLPEYAYKADKIKQFVSNPKEKNGTLTFVILPSI